MMKIIARHVIRTECIEDYQKLAAELVAETRKEPGCLFYTLNQSTSDPRVHCFMEGYKDKAAIEAHNSSEYFQRIVPQFAGLLDEPELVEVMEQII